MTFEYEYPKADNTVDAVVFGLSPKDCQLMILLIRRGREGEPFYGHWALPGGFINMDEGLDESFRRELVEETGVTLTYVEQLYTFGQPDRDPRGRVISTAYLALVRPEDVTVKAADDASEAMWWPLSELPPLAFDHAEIIQVGLKRLRSKLSWQPVGIELLPEYFTLYDLQRVYESILGRKLDKRNFRKRVLSYGVLGETDRTQTTNRRGPPAKLYRFLRAAYFQKRDQGLDFEV
jgi:8-oxo-dGTP diphosphatase